MRKREDWKANIRQKRNERETVWKKEGGKKRVPYGKFKAGKEKDSTPIETLVIFCSNLCFVLKLWLLA